MERMAIRQEGTSFGEGDSKAQCSLALNPKSCETHETRGREDASNHKGQGEQRQCCHAGNHHSGGSGSTHSDDGGQLAHRAVRVNLAGEEEGNGQGGREAEGEGGGERGQVVLAARHREVHEVRAGSHAVTGDCQIIGSRDTCMYARTAVAHRKENNLRTNDLVLGMISFLRIMLPALFVSQPLPPFLPTALSLSLSLSLPLSPSLRLPLPFSARLRLAWWKWLHRRMSVVVMPVSVEAARQAAVMGTDRPGELRAGRKGGEEGGWGGNEKGYGEGGREEGGEEEWTDGREIC